MKITNKILGALLLWGAAAQATPPGPVSTNALFPAPKCNMSEALPLLRQKLDGKDLQTEWDGDFPWPDVLGVWTKGDRDAYAVVGAAETPAGKWGRVQITIRSICSGAVLAQGAKIITDSDWTKEHLVVRLRNYSLNGSRLTALIKTPSSIGKLAKPNQEKKLEVKIIQDVVLDDGSLSQILRDSFIADKL